MKRSKKLIIIITCIILVCAVLGTVLGVTLAKWKEQATATQIVDLDIEKYNPSAPYIIYFGLDSDGEFTTVTSRIVSWAVVGYKGLVAELIIPEKHTENGLTKPVTHILAHPDYINERLAGNSIITEITISASVEFIGSGVCSMMNELKQVKIEKSIVDEEGEEEVKTLTISDLAFAGCGQLTVFDNMREDTEGNFSSYLQGTPIVR